MDSAPSFAGAYLAPVQDPLELIDPFLWPDIKHDPESIVRDWSRDMAAEVANEYIEALGSLRRAEISPYRSLQAGNRTFNLRLSENEDAHISWKSFSGEQFALEVTTDIKLRHMVRDEPILAAQTIGRLFSKSRTSTEEFTGVEAPFFSVLASLAAYNSYVENCEDYPEPVELTTDIWENHLIASTRLGAIPIPGIEMHMPFSMAYQQGKGDRTDHFLKMTIFKSTPFVQQYDIEFEIDATSMRRYLSEVNMVLAHHKLPGIPIETISDLVDQCSLVLSNQALEIFQKEGFIQHDLLDQSDMEPLEVVEAPDRKTCQAIMNISQATHLSVDTIHTPKGDYAIYAEHEDEHGEQTNYAIYDVTSNEMVFTIDGPSVEGALKDPDVLLKFCKNLADNTLGVKRTSNEQRKQASLATIAVHAIMEILIARCDGYGDDDREYRYCIEATYSLDGSIYLYLNGSLIYISKEVNALGPIYNFCKNFPAPELCFTYSSIINNTDLALTGIQAETYLESGCSTLNHLNIDPKQIALAIDAILGLSADPLEDC